MKCPKCKRLTTTLLKCNVCQTVSCLNSDCKKEQFGTTNVPRNAKCPVCKKGKIVAI